MTTIPIDPKLFWGASIFLASVAFVGIYVTLASVFKRDGLGQLKSKFGATSVNDGLFLCAILLWAAIALSLTGGLLTMIWELIWYAAPIAGDGIAPDPNEQKMELRIALVRLTAFTATLGAVIALPFTVIRLKLTGEQNETAAEQAQTAAEQARTAIESLFNDKINAATDDLHAMRQISKTMEGVDGKKTTQTLWQDDITRRNAAIDRLEGLANERPDTAPRISRLLSVYVRELSREYPPVETPEGATPDGLKDWASTLKVQRSDMENAVQVLGRLQGIKHVDPSAITIDLRGANLQGFDLKRLELSESNFSHAKMQGADLSWAEMPGANLSNAEMQGADLSWAKMQGANLRGAEMQGADLSNAEMQGANLRRAEMQGADLSEATLKGADLSRAEMQRANLSGAEMDERTSLTTATLQAAAVREVDYTTLPQMRDFIDGIFGDGSVTLPPDTAWPAHWPKHELGYSEFEIEWKKWRDDPDNYEPPVQQDDQTAEAAE
ncbi:pentapeptide repeat-containing protein [Parasedimentitalea psychrophila]|uniref:Pentapeptide repeat-containing protein n=1 Tax=Parasedimentitalea psychrophila TaxID=2997337 RepID=A0A9Y2KXC9_9RHOB|nr:pentapeptide repeat-containing protein [Parasedimentitalea psychrophila]WIY23592.1 pentapeptide repeat-containing protein [Parasedimentitalea psychrophila]